MTSILPFWHIFSAVLVFFVGAIILTKIGSKILINYRRSFVVYCWHTCFCILYLWYAITNGADSIDYYNSAFLGELDFSLGTASVSVLTYFLINFFGLSIFGCFLVFNVLGTVGLLLFYACLKVATQYKSRAIQRFVVLIVFLPSISFWSSAIGKDSISFLAVGLAMWAVLNLNRRIFLMMLAIFLMLLVRPHIAGLMIIAYSFALIFGRELGTGKRLFLGGSAIAVTAVLVPFALQFAGLNSIANDSLVDYVAQRQSFNTEGGGGLDIATMSLPMKLISYLFRPFIFEAFSVFSLAAAIDNTVLFFLFLMSVKWIFKKGKRKFIGNQIFLWSYSLLTLIVLSMTTANMGIALRQKWMFVPIFIFLMLSIIGTEREKIRRILPRSHATSQ